MKLKKRVKTSKLRTRNIRVKLSKNVKTKLNKKFKTQLETVPAQEIEDIFSNPSQKDQVHSEQTVLMNWKNFISKNGISRTEYQQMTKDYNSLMNGVRKSILQPVPQNSYRDTLVTQRK